MRAAQTALISVSDKTGLIDLGRNLHQLGIEILASGGTGRALAEAGVGVVPVETVTGFPESLGGRVKTLHPKIHGGILARRDHPADRQEVEALGLRLIDIVVVNLYPFEWAIARPETTYEEAVENIDIGGPALLRAAAKNHADCAVVVDPADYPLLLAALDENRGVVPEELRGRWARKAFALSASYDSAIARYLARGRDHEEPFPDCLVLSYRKAMDLRYGENPHQSAALYRDPASPHLDRLRQLQGKELSYNNWLDLDAALQLVWEFDETAAVVVKHTNPCGAATGATPAEACRRAFETDPVSAFGGIVAFNRALDEPAARELAEQFLEVIVAPEFAAGSLSLLHQKKNLRLLSGVESQRPGPNGRPLLCRSIVGGLLLQDADLTLIEQGKLRTVTQRHPTTQEMEDLLFAWKVAAHVRSNAVVFARHRQTVGIGAGQMSRVDAARLAVSKAQLPTRGSCVASDGFFPFRDGVDVAAEAGATAIAQPGGSVRDQEVIEAADQHGLAMVFTGVRHFRH